MTAGRQGVGESIYCSHPTPPQKFQNGGTERTKYVTVGRRAIRLILSTVTGHGTDTTVRGEAKGKLLLILGLDLDNKAKPGIKPSIRPPVCWQLIKPWNHHF